MSNIYIQEPPALGKVLLQTSVGEIDIELWTKEAPKACRNFIQLCMEEYYKGTLFHRVVPDFIVQGGDPNGDGTGGESIYGAPFKDEFHQRLRFNRRGLVAMANAGKDDNGSQFFFTLAGTPELQNKHTIFGKVVGDSIYTMLKLAEGEIGPDERPLYPRKITGATVVINPFEDIAPRRRQPEAARDEPKKKKEKGTKNFGLLSFGDEAEEEETGAGSFVGAKSSHDLLDDPKLSHNTAADLCLNGDEAPLEPKAVDPLAEAKNIEAVSNIRDKLKRKQAPNTEKEHSRSREKEKKKKECAAAETESSVDSSDSEEYYIGKDRDVARRKERDRIRDEIIQLKQDIKKPKEAPASEAEFSTTSKDDSNELKKQYEEEQEKYRKQNENIPKTGAARVKKRVRRGKNAELKIRRAPKRPWVKNLYENREYPDNYTNERFLDELKKNLYVEKVTFLQAFTGTFRITLRLCLCVMFSVLFFHMRNGSVSTDAVILSFVLIVVLGYAIFIIYGTEKRSVAYDLKTVLAYLVIGYLVSPILHTLTDTVSTDTIYALTVIMMLIHLIFFDYGVPAAIVSNSLSVNAVIFASVCLVSRLSNAFDAFVLLTVSVLTFVSSQQLVNVILGTILFSIAVVIVLVATVYSLFMLSSTLLWYFILVIGFLNVWCPVMFVRWQKYKDNIHGPWDEAVVRDSDNVSNFDLQMENI